MTNFAEPGQVSTLTITFCGEAFPVEPNVEFALGREGDLAIDDNPYLHRRFLILRSGGGLWWLHNVGKTLAATVADRSGLMQAWLAPGGAIPLVFPQNVVFFTAGPTTYEIEIDLREPAFVPNDVADDPAGGTTVGRATLSPSQRLLVLALAEPVLRAGALSVANLPTSSAAARRLGWPLTTFNRKLDHVCQKLADAGVKGLHGGSDKLATNRRSRLVEYALASRFVTSADLPLLDSQRPLPSRGGYDRQIEDASGDQPFMSP